MLMTSIEHGTENGINKEEIIASTDKKIVELLDGPPSDNYMRRQMQLVVEKHSIEHPDEKLSHDILGKIMMEWVDSDWSKAFSAITKNEAFSNHPRFSGNVAHITFEDVQFWMKNKALPER